MSDFFTISAAREGFYKEKGSKFFAHAMPVTSEEEVTIQLSGLRKKYHDARHHCYAWVLGLDDQKWRTNDDGEPSHSAGDPILGQIRSFQLTNVLVVVVRYFGGTKLGVGGLINAYKTAAQQALADAPPQKIFVMKSLQMSFDYDQLSAVEKLISDFDLADVDRQYHASCQVSASIKKSDIEGFLAATKDFYNIRINLDS